MAKSANKAVEDGMHTITPHLVCRDAAAAIDFYKRAFGAEETMRLPGPDGKIMHASIKIGDSTVMLAEESPDWGSLGPQALKGSPVSIHMKVDDVDKVFAKAVAAGAKETMAVADMFWGDRYGTLQDPFGHRWSIATHIRDVPYDELVKAGAEAMKNMPKPPAQKRAQ